MRVTVGAQTSARPAADVQAVLRFLLNTAVVRTLTAVVSLDFSDDAVVKRGVTKSILEEFCRNIQGLSVSCTITIMSVCGGWGWGGSDFRAHPFQSVSPGSPSPRILQVPGTDRQKHVGAEKVSRIKF